MSKLNCNENDPGVQYQTMLIFGCHQGALCHLESGTALHSLFLEWSLMMTIQTPDVTFITSDSARRQVLAPLLNTKVKELLQ